MYCNTVCGNCGETLKDKLQKLQNRFARVVTKTKYGSMEPDVLLKNLGWLNVQQRIELDTASMVHKAINNVAPSYLSELFHKTKTVHNHDTSGSTHGLLPKHSNLKFGQRRFASYGCKVWIRNRDAQATEEPKRFKKALPEKLLDKTKK